MEHFLRWRLGMFLLHQLLVVSSRGNEGGEMHRPRPSTHTHTHTIHTFSQMHAHTHAHTAPPSTRIHCLSNKHHFQPGLLPLRQRWH